MANPIIPAIKNSFSRLNHHLKDRHKRKWDRFNFYAIRSQKYVKDLESILIRVARPRGIRQLGGFGKDTNLRKKLQREIIGSIRADFSTRINMKTYALLAECKGTPNCKGRLNFGFTTAESPEALAQAPNVALRISPIALWVDVIVSGHPQIPSASKTSSNCSLGIHLPSPTWK